MSRAIILLLLAICFGCTSKKSSDNEQIKSNVSKISNIVQPDSAGLYTQEWANYAPTAERLNELYEEMNKFAPHDNYKLEDFINNIETPIITLITGDLANDKILDLIVLQFFLKAYLCNLDGDEYMYNVSCCLKNSIYVAFFVQRFYRISNYDPTGGLLNSDIYNWVISDSYYSKLHELQDLLKQIAQKKELLEDK